MIYQEAIDYIKNIERSGSDFGLERVRELLDLLGEPDDGLKFIHVAGTNGKGSVCAYLTSILHEAGLKVGGYNSPSVFFYNERFSINGLPIADHDIARYMTCVKETIENENILRSAFSLEPFNPTAFEIETAIAMLCFYSENCDICVLETGLGGRWDATNAISQKELAVITKIGLDHCDLLGNTLGEIASEKAAIIKNLAVTCSQCDEVMHEIRNPFHFENGEKKQFSVNIVVAKNAQSLSSDLDGQDFLYDGKQYHISMLGDHQIENASLAICAVQSLNRNAFVVPNSAIEIGLAKTVWKARFEIVRDAEQRFNLTVPTGKTLVLDGSHNPQGAKTLANCLRKYFKDKSIHLVLGILADKDYQGIVAEIAPLATKITCVSPPSPRALSKEKLQIEAMKCCDYVNTCDNIKSAVKNAIDGDCQVVVVCGSLTLFESLSQK